MINDVTTRSFDAMNAYGQIQQSLQAASGEANTDASTEGSMGSFSSALSGALQNAVQTGKVAESQTASGLSGRGDMTEIATSVAEAKLTLQTVTAVRDRFVQAYQDVMKMSI